MDVPVILRKTKLLPVVLFFLLFRLPEVESQAQWIDVTFNLVEEIQADTVIGNVALTARLQEKYGNDLTGFDYQLLPVENTQYSGLFSINSYSSELRTAQLIDRDEICPEQLNCQITIEVGALTPDNSYDFIRVNIIIADVNDNAPEFSSDRLSVLVSESSNPGVVRLLPTASDKDVGAYGVQRYEFITNTNKFELGKNEQSDGTVELQLVLMEKLDREVEDAYVVELVAFDGGNPARQATLFIDITVTDANDNRPVFEQESYEVLISESFPIDHSILQVKAVDKDAGINGQIVYSFAPQTESDFGDIFAINETSGTISLKQGLDYESRPSYRLSVSATDLGTDAIPTRVRVDVLLEDVNDYAPKITVAGVNAGADIQVYEHGAVGDIVANVRVSDGDSGPSGEFDCDLVDNNFGLVKIFSSLYQITAKNVFDRESLSEYSMTLECVDHGSPALEASEEITIKVADINDNSPSLSQTVYTSAIDENSAPGIFLIDVNATDLDVGLNADLIYQLTGENANVFLAIDPKTGIITTRGPFDYEAMSSFTCRVVVRDQGTPVRSASASVVIHIKDTNDQAPVFSQISYDFATYENQPIGTEIGSVSAADPDSPPYDRVVFGFDEYRTNTGFFAIDADSGKITIKNVLNRESTAVHNLIVVATNPQANSPTSSASVTIHVADVNDNAPSIEFPRKSNDTVHVPAEVPIGFVFSRILATDADFGPNARLLYSIIKGNYDFVFAIDQNSGMLTINKPLDNYDLDEFHLTIQVKDQGTEPKTATSMLRIIVNDTLVVPYVDGHGAQYPGDLTRQSKQNQMILIIMSAVTVVLVAILITAICYVRRKKSVDDEELSYRYKTDEVDQNTSADSREAMTSRAGPHVTTSSSSHARHNPNLDTSRETGEGESDKQDLYVPGYLPNALNRHLSPEDTMHQKIEVPIVSLNIAPHSRTPSLNQLSQPIYAAVHKASKAPRHRPINDPALRPDMQRPWELTEKDLEVHRLLQMAMHEQEGAGLVDSDDNSNCSVQISNSDSGRGNSDDGDNGTRAASPMQHRPNMPVGSYDAPTLERKPDNRNGSISSKRGSRDGSQMKHRYDSVRDQVPMSTFGGGSLPRHTTSSHRLPYNNPAVQPVSSEPVWTPQKHVTNSQRTSNNSPCFNTTNHNSSNNYLNQSPHNSVIDGKHANSAKVPRSILKSPDKLATSQPRHVRAPYLDSVV